MVASHFVWSVGDTNLFSAALYGVSVTLISFLSGRYGLRDGVTRFNVARNTECFLEDAARNAVRL